MNHEYPHTGKDLEILHSLWSAGIAADPYTYNLHQDFTLEDVQEYCKLNNIKHMVCKVSYQIVYTETDL